MSARNLTLKANFCYRKMLAAASHDVIIYQVVGNSEERDMKVETRVTIFSIIMTYMIDILSHISFSLQI